MRIYSILFTTSLLMASVTAQTQLVRGEVDSIQGTNQFRLDCTTVRVVTSAPGINLQTLHDLTQQNDNVLELQVINVGTVAQPVLDIQSFAVIPELFDMGNLRIGESQSWEVFGPVGASAFVFLTVEAATGYLPFAGAGAWVMGGNAVLFRAGTVGGQGRFRFEFTTPNLPTAIGTVLTAQAATVVGSTLTLTNPDCKEIEN